MLENVNKELLNTREELVKAERLSTSQAGGKPSA